MGQRSYDILKAIMSAAESGMNARTLRTRIMLKYGFNPDTVTPDQVPDGLEESLQELAREYTAIK